MSPNTKKLVSVALGVERGRIDVVHARHPAADIVHAIARLGRGGERVEQRRGLAARPLDEHGHAGAQQVRDPLGLDDLGHRFLLREGLRDSRGVWMRLSAPASRDDVAPAARLQVGDRTHQVTGSARNFWCPAMHETNWATWQHSHAFGLDQRNTGERRTLSVALLTTAMMVGEIVGGLVFESMALLADGWHMGTHAAALGVAAFVYMFARKHADDSRYSFGTGKVSALGGFTSALLRGRGVRAHRERAAVGGADPLRQAIAVACLGLVVNGVCVAIPGGPSRSRARPSRPRSSSRASRSQPARRVPPRPGRCAHVGARDRGPHHGQVPRRAWMDPLMGVVGSLSSRAGRSRCCATRPACCSMPSSPPAPRGHRAHDRGRRTIASSICTCGGSGRGTSPRIGSSSPTSRARPSTTSGSSPGSAISCTSRSRCIAAPTASGRWTAEVIRGSRGGARGSRRARGPWCCSRPRTRGRFRVRRRLRLTKFSSRRARAAHRLKVKPNPGYVFAVHAANDEPDTAKADAVAQYRIVGQPGANEIRKRRFIVPLGERRGSRNRASLPSRNFAGEVNPPLEHQLA